MAAFRGVFPAHEKTPGSLKMHQAMLAAVEHPHAYGEGLEFLVSKGPPEVQIPGHVRWSEYDDLTCPGICTSGGPLLTRNSDRKSTRLNSSHVAISYAVVYLEKH